MESVPTLVAVDMVLVPTLTVGALLAATRNMADNFVRRLYPGFMADPAALAVSAIIIFTVIRRRGFTRAEAIWAAVTLLFCGAILAGMKVREGAAEPRRKVLKSQFQGAMRLNARRKREDRAAHRRGLA